MGLMPQAATKIERIRKGAHALKTCPPVHPSFPLPQAAASWSNVQLSLGCQNLRKNVRQRIEVMDARISGSKGPRKLEDKYWTIANDPPLTKQAGQTSTPFFQPDISTTR